MVDGFIRQSNGFLRIYSELDHGTTVKMYLPAIPPQNNPKTILEDLQTDPKAKGEKGRILVVEDESSILRVISITLSKAGYDVSTASSGDQALQEYAGDIGSFDILLTDVVMPGNLQGPALAENLTRRCPDLKVIFISGFPNEAAIHGNGLRASDRFLMKPVMRAQLLQSVRDALNA